MRKPIAVTLAAVLIAACGEDPSGVGGQDAAPVADASNAGVDAGGTDSGGADDAQSTDAGTTAGDGGTADAAPGGGSLALLPRGLPPPPIQPLVSNQHPNCRQAIEHRLDRLDLGALEAGENLL